MVSVEYSEAITEVLDILNHMKKVDLDKIPIKFKQFLVNNQSTNYHPKLDHTKEIKDMNLKEKTKSILAVIYSNYWCSNEKKKEFNNLIIENERKHQEKLKDKYSTENIFKKKEEKRIEEAVQENLPVKLEEKESIFTKIIKFIKNIFR